MSAAIESRRRACTSLSSQLAHMDDRQLRAAVKCPQGAKDPWGVSYPADLGGARVFVKRVPVTDRESARPWSTRNHFRLPTRYNYGFGSAGFGAYRELVAHLTTTNWVAEGSTPAFPMLLHHRVVDRPKSGAFDREVIGRYERQWSSRAVGEFMTARVEATQELWLVLEHVPHLMSDWLMNNQDGVEDVVDQIFAAVSVLRDHGMVHFDLHFANVLTDGETVHVADFGLLNDGGYDLTKSERAFLERHGHYDYASAILAIGIAPMWRVWTQPSEARPGLLASYPWLQGLERTRDLTSAVIDNANAMTKGPLAIIPAYADALRRYREVILYMGGFHDAMWENPRRNTSYYDDYHVQRLLKKAGASIA